MAPSLPFKVSLLTESMKKMLAQERSMWPSKVAMLISSVKDEGG